MSYIGKEPQVGAYNMLDSLTASATADYSLTLDSTAFVPESANHLLVSLNGVIQKAGSSFTVSGSTLSFSSALTSSDSIDFVLALGNVLDIGVPSDLTISTAKIIDDAVTQAKLADESVNEAKLQVSNSPTNGYFLSAQSGNTGGLTWATASGRDGTPNWLVRKITTDQTFSQNTEQKITFNSELFDSDNGFDTASTNLYTIPTGEGGVYCINAGLHYSSSAGGNTNNDQYWCMLDHNGTRVAYSRLYHEPDIARQQVNLSTLISVSAGDTLGIYGYSEQGSGNVEVGASTTPYFTWFSGFRVA